DRGYTGHQHLKEFGIINMNGRLYDPIVGRMLNPDNFVQDATSTQAFNRYSYVVNNPLKYTDPSGWLKYQNIDDDWRETSYVTYYGIDWEGPGRGSGGTGFIPSTNYVFTQNGFANSEGGQLIGSGAYSSADNWGSSTGWTMSTYNSYTYVPFNSNAGTYTAPTGDMAAMGGGTQNGGSSQTFLKIIGNKLLDGKNAQSTAKNIGKELGLTGGPYGTRNAFIHLFGYITIALSNYTEAKELSINHEKGEEGIDTEVDKLNNSLVFDKYYNRIKSMNITFTSKYQLAIEIIKLMHTDGFYRGDLNSQKPIFRYLTKGALDKYIEILNGLNK
ncbi:MAG: hypothetical protein K1X55_16125, partial [Chitinophagales bacterium]|nr:hypothetical protein [Chitinophagales bacterium]